MLMLKKLITQWIILLLWSMPSALLSTTIDLEKKIRFLTNKDKVLIINIDATISKNLLTELTDLLSQQTAMNKIIVLLNSMGGDGEAAIQIGQLFREKKVEVFVSNKCASACIFSLFGGIIRGANSAAIGIHAPRLTLSTDGGLIIEELAETGKKSYMDYLDAFDVTAINYLKAMNIPIEFQKKIKHYPTQKVRWLTYAETEDLKITGFEPTLVNHKHSLISNKKILHTTRKCRKYTEDLQLFFECYKLKDRKSVV